MKKIIFFTAFLHTFFLWGQNFERLNIPTTENGSLLSQAWTGGLNSCLFSEIDFNLDGVKDLLLFDKSSNRVLPFIKNGNSYNYQHEFVSDFPEPYEIHFPWMQAIDYNCDNKNDLFVFNGVGLSVYKNTSMESLSFELITDFLPFQLDGNTLSLFVLDNTLPYLGDFDNDGDIDIMSFSSFGLATVHYYKNKSIENTGSCGLELELETDCWGNFSEAGGFYALGSCGDGEMLNRSSTSADGAYTMNFIDIDADQDQDLLLGHDIVNNINLLFNNGDNEGMGYFPFTVRNGLRCSTAVGYLNPIKKRKNLKVVTNAHVKNIEFDNKKADKVNYWIGNEVITVKANKEVILSSGTIGSPHILQASGIGPGELLKKNNVNVVKDHPGVGMNLTDHLMLRPVYKVKNLESLNDIYYSMTKKFMTGLKYLLFRKGPLTVGASYLCGFVKSDPHLATPNLQFHVSPASTDVLGKGSLHKFTAFTPSITNVRPTSRGSIELKSSDTRVSPKIKMNYLSTDEDREIAGKALKITRNIVMNSKAYKKYEPEEYRPGIHITDNEELAKEAGKFCSTIFHPVSTCRMGSDENAVVSDRLVAHGLKNLRIVDASVMPSITSGNTNAPTIMIAEKAADMIIEDAR